MSLAHRVAPLALLLAACSNGTGPETNPGTTTTPDACAAIASSCVAKQQGCVSDGAEARCEPCKAGEYASLAGACKELAGTPISHEFNQFTTKPGEEVLGLCQSWTLNNAEEIWVNAVELSQDESSHHSNWTYVPDDQYPGADGVWPCQERDYHQLNAALFGGVLYAQSTQATHEVQKFPEGAAIRIPPYSRIIGDVHLLNTGDSDVTGSVKLSMYALPVDEVKIKLVPFHLTYDGLNIPPHATSRFTGNCAVGDEFPAKLLAMKVHYILPHTHAMASGFFVDVLGGPDDGKRLIELKGFTSEAHGLAFDPPIDMAEAKGFSFGCEYVNTRAEAVGWGFGDQEMCELLGFAESQRAFESRVDTADPAGSEGEVQLFTGDCGTIAYPWDHKKPGGPGPM
jgi:hypothetical protein